MKEILSSLKDKYLSLTIVSILFSIASFSQTGWEPGIYGKTKFRDSLLLTKYKNNLAGDSVLTTDVNGKVKLVLKSGGISAFTFTPNYNNKLFLLYTNGVLTDSVPSGVKDVHGINGISVIDSIGNVYISGSGSGSTDTSLIREIVSDSLAHKINISDTAAMLSGYQTVINSKQPLLVSGTNIKTVNGNSLLGSGDVVISAGSSLPTQTGKMNNYLKTDGTNTSWSRLKFMNPAYWELFGDSYTLGDGATAPSTDAYYVLLSNLYNKTYTNRAVTGKGIYSASGLHNANINPPASISVYNTAMTSVMIGVNDLNRSGSNQKTINKILNGYKSIFTNQFLSSYVGAGAGTGVTRTGTWNAAYNAVTFGGKFTTAATTATNGSYIEYAFIGNNVNVGLQGGDGVGAIRATFSVTIDGVSAGSFTENNQSDGISDGVNNNQRSPMALNFFGLTDSNHVIRLTNTSSDTLVVDYFGIMKQPSFCYPVVMFQIPYFITYSSGSNALTLQVNNSLDSLVRTYSDYPIVIAKTNQYLNSYNVDNIHPSTKGHRQIYEAGYRAMDSLLNSNVNQLLYAGAGNNNILGALRVLGNTSAINPMPINGTGPSLEIYTTVTPVANLLAYNRTTATQIPLSIVGSTLTLNSGFFSSNGNFLVGSTTDIPSSQLSIVNNTSVLPKGAISAPKITLNKRDSITSSILTTTKTASGSGYSSSGSNVAFTCVSCANPLAAGAIALSVNVSAGAVTSYSAQINGTNYTVGDQLTASFNGGTGFNVTVATVNTGVSGLQTYVTDQNQVSIYNGTSWSGALYTSSASTLPLLHGNDYVFTGSTATYTMPAPSATIIGRQNAIEVINEGSGTITLNSASGSQLYTTSLQASITIIAGASVKLLPVGANFKVVYNQ